MSINPINHLIGAGRKMEYILSHADSTNDMRTAQGASTSRHPANQFLLLDSADRLPLNKILTAPANPNDVLAPVELQPWNNFQFQKPQSLMEAFAKRIAITEVRMPWFIPNVNAYNNSWTIACLNNNDNVDLRVFTNFTIVVPIRFYTPDSLVTTVQGLLDAKFAITAPNGFGDRITFAYDDASNTYGIYFTSATPDALNNLVLYSFPSTSVSGTMSSNSTYARFISQANFFNLVGWPFAYQNTRMRPLPTIPLVGIPSESLYTEFVDFTSNKAHEFTNLRDGNSGDTATTSLCRIYLCDDVSINESPWIGTAPIVLHRQFRHAKFIRFNPESVISWLDLQVRDAWGNLVPLPAPISVPTFLNTGTTFVLQPYPDFQITILASED